MSTRTIRTMFLTLAAATSLAVVAACGDTAGEGSDGTSEDGNSDDSSDDGSEEKSELTLVLASPSMTWLPAYIADTAGYYDEVGLDLELITTSTGQTTTAAVLSGDADIAGAGTQAPLQAFDQGQTTKIISVGMTDDTAVIAASNEWMDQHSLTSDSSMEEKIAALDDARIGVASIGSGSDLLFRYIIQEHGGDPEGMDIAPIWPATAQLTAMEQGRMDVGTIAVPGVQIAENQEVGQLFIDTINGGAPVLDGVFYTVYTVTPAVLEEKREALVKFAAALGMANELIHTEPAEAAQIAHEGAYSETDADLLQQSIEFLAGAVPSQLEVDPAAMQRAIDVWGEVYGTNLSVTAEEAMDYTIGQDADAYLESNQ